MIPIECKYAKFNHAKKIGAILYRFIFLKNRGTAKTTGDPVGMSACPPYQVQKAGEIYLNRSRRRNFGFNLYYSALIDDHSPIS